MNLLEEYKERHKKILTPLAPKLLADLKEYLQNSLRIDQISVRPKDVDSFINKANKRLNDELKYDDPINQIQDQIGARVVVYYLTDVEIIASKILSNYRSIEEKFLIPESDSEFGYFGKHLILKLPTEVIDNPENTPNFFELQIKTLFQHSWGQAAHDLSYKGEMELTREQKRKIAFTAAQAWGADLLFSELQGQVSKSAQNQN